MEKAAKEQQSPEEKEAAKVAKAEAKAAAKAEKAEAAKAAKVIPVSQNGIVRPKAGTATGRVWEVADQLSAKANAPAPRKDVLEVTKSEGINEATAATQYGRWCCFNGLSKQKEKAE